MLVFLLPVIGTAQDFHLSQYDAAPLYLNPAMSGMFNGKYRLHAHYRTQWSSIAFKPFVTTALSYDMPIKKFGFGAQVMNNRAGAGNYNVFSVLLSGAYDLSLDSDNKNHIALGVQGGIIQKSIDLQKLYFNNQYSNSNGGAFDQTIPSGEMFSNSSVMLPDLSAGFMYYYADEKSRINPFVGFSAFHLTNPKETFFANSNELPTRYVLHAGFKFNINETVQLSPKFLMMQQSNAKEMTYSLIAHYYLKDSDSYLLFGPTYRNKDAAIFEAGLKTGKYIYKVSYDINTSTLNPSTKGRGGFEISVTYITKRPRPAGAKSCPRL